ncbi:reverse transcriptase domain-containing protein, partial [Salmonella enterica]
MPFGLTNAPASFQRCMNFVTHGIAHCMVYIDDLLIFSTSFEEHLEDLRTVFVRLRHYTNAFRINQCAGIFSKMHEFCH